MIKREHIKQAIDAISKRNPEIGYSLDQMLGMGVIDTAVSDQAMDGDNPYFVFDDEKVLVNRVLFFNEGHVPIEQALLIKYGELGRKQELQDKNESFNYRDASAEIHQAGLRLAVTYEIDYAIRRLRSEFEDKQCPTGERRQEQVRELIVSLEAMKKDERALEIREGDKDLSYFYRGSVDEATPAYFMKFPVSMGALMQVADMDLDFFNVRFVLDCMLRGLENNLMACVAGASIVGLIYLTVRERLFGKDLILKYLATLRGKTWNPKGLSPKPLKGVGTFLVAGVWMLWKNDMPGLREIALMDAEVGARQFYEAIGFEPRGLSGYVLKMPRGYLLRSILTMSHHCRHLRPELIHDLNKLTAKEVRRLRKKSKADQVLSRLGAAISAMQDRSESERQDEPSESAGLQTLQIQSWGAWQNDCYG